LERIMNVADFLESQQVDFSVVPHQETFDAQRMANVLHVSGNDVAKTVLVRANGGFSYLVVVLPASKQIDMSRLSHMIGDSKVELATELEIGEHCPDCEFGALPPFGSQYGMRTVVDRGLAGDKEIVFEGNNHHEAIRMRFEDFRRIESPLVGDFAR
jgi:Ala-tRNA(Pro) deacylase